MTTESCYRGVREQRVAVGHLDDASDLLRPEVAGKRLDRRIVEPSQREMVVQRSASSRRTEQFRRYLPERCTSSTVTGAVVGACIAASRKAIDAGSSHCASSTAISSGAPSTASRQRGANAAGVTAPSNSSRGASSRVSIITRKAVSGASERIRSPCARKMRLGRVEGPGSVPRVPIHAESRALLPAPISPSSCTSRNCPGRSEDPSMSDMS